MNTALKMATDPKTGEVNQWLYMVLLDHAVYGDYPTYSDYTPSVSAPSGGYSASSPVMVIQPTPGMTVMQSGGITTYQSPKTYCVGGYGVTNCF